MAVFDFLDFIWYKLFGLDLMVTGNHRFIIFIIFIIILCIISHIVAMREVRFASAKAFIITFVVSCIFSILFLTTIPKAEYKVLNKEDMVLIKPNNKSINTNIKGQFSNYKDFIEKDKNNDDVIKLDNLTLYLGG